MSAKILKSRIQTRRLTNAEYEEIKNTFIPLKGEVLLIDTLDKGMRSKVGDGTTLIAQLPFTDEDLRDEIGGIIARGYYYEGQFYADLQHKVTIVPYEYKIYIDKHTWNLYCYDAGEQAYQLLVQMPIATNTTAGIAKLYDAVGNNTDGAMTQHSITNEIGKKFNVDVGEDEEIIFTNGILA